jgi:2-hydroxychromene-2-carboxylate isomerase
LQSATPVLFFDLGSPYAYLAAERAATVLATKPQLEPILLGGIFAQRGFGSWSATPVRDVRVAEIERRASRYGLPPLRWPDAWPADGLTAMRCATWAKREQKVEEFARAVFEREFAGGEDISDPAVLCAAAGDAGLDGEEMLRAAASPEIKAALREATQRAWDCGVRGVPSLRVGPALFYGDDQLELAAAALREQPAA